MNLPYHFFSGLAHNPVLATSLLAWFLAQALKPLIEYFSTHRWNFGLWFSSGGMPSSHSALVISAMVSIGLYHGTHTPEFALAVAVAMVIVYDAAGVRREAGRHAERINIVINELFSGQPISEEQLKEVLGHSPLEVAGGTLLGALTALFIWAFWVQ